MFHRKSKTSTFMKLVAAAAALKGSKQIASLTAAGVGGYVLYRFFGKRNALPEAAPSM